MADGAVRTRLAEGGRVVIPAEFRRAIGLEVGDEVIVRLEDGEVRILTPESAIRRAQDLVRRYVPEGRSLVDELLAERRDEVARSASRPR
ncbi:MAG TPA: AbrB/MazE/SpoVT family DNA-binding domain-containing protein [Chloroflexota bacterium]|nr:AbrB/MazE/SpoVT family DNA-binding domain-containing protein [Chloroflexota bacterium]